MLFILGGIGLMYDDIIVDVVGVVYGVIVEVNEEVCVML